MIATGRVKIVGVTWCNDAVVDEKRDKTYYKILKFLLTERLLLERS